MDVWYVDNYSFSVDMRILWQTAIAVLARRASAPTDMRLSQRLDRLTRMAVWREQPLLRQTWTAPAS